MQLGSVLVTTDPHFRDVVQIVAEILEPELAKSQPGN